MCVNIVIEGDSMRIMNVEAQKERQLEISDLGMYKTYENLQDQKYKRILCVYIDVIRNRKLITNAAAYSLGLLVYRDYATDDKGYYEVTDKMIEEFEKQGIKIEYKYINKKILRVYCDLSTGEKFIDYSAAYSLGLLTYQQYISSENSYYKVTNAFLKSINVTEIEIEYHYINRPIWIKYDLKANKKYINKKVAFDLGLIPEDNLDENELGYYFLTDEIIKDLEQQGYKIQYEFVEDQIENLNRYEKKSDEIFVSNNIQDFKSLINESERNYIREHYDYLKNKQNFKK